MGINQSAAVHVLIVTQVFPPDPAAVGQQLADVAQELARRGHEITVVTSDRGYDDPSARYAGREERDGVLIRRLGWCSFGKRSFAARMLGGGSFTLQAAWCGPTRPRDDVILVTTVPIMGPCAGLLLSGLRGSGLVYSVADKMVVIPPWSHTEPSSPLDHRDNPFRRQLGITDELVVMYSGNHGITSPLSTLVAAAESLAGEPRIKFLFIGGRARKHEVDAARSPHVRSRPYQPLASIGESLAAAGELALSREAACDSLRRVMGGLRGVLGAGR
jgi:hypothetical protein